MGGSSEGPVRATGLAPGKFRRRASPEVEAGRGQKEAARAGRDESRAEPPQGRRKGFFGSDLADKVLLPQDARRAETALRGIGLSGQVKAILAINRGAEDAVGEAAPIFTGAIEEMTVTDALGIIRGNKDAGATNYFRRKTSD